MMQCQVMVKIHTVAFNSILSNCLKRRDSPLCFLKMKATVHSVDTYCFLMLQGHVKATLSITKLKMSPHSARFAELQSVWKVSTKSHAIIVFHDRSSLLLLSSRVLTPIPNSQWFLMSGCWHTWPGFSSHSLFRRCCGTQGQNLD